MKRFTAFLPLPLLDYLRARAVKDGYTVAELIRHILQRAMDQDKDK